MSQTDVGADHRPRPPRADAPHRVPDSRSRPLSEPAPGLRPPVARRRHGLPRGPLVEIAIVLAGIVAYFGARGLTESDADVAVAHAHDVVAFERALGLYLEPQLQELVLGHELLIDALNWVYIWGHWPVIAVVLVWTLRRHPRAYVVLRNALVISGAIGVVVFVLYPVAPPRLAGLGLLDSVSERSHAYRVLQPPAFVNQYAAIPSLHVGWDLLIGITIVRCARHPLVRLIGVLLPIAMVASVVLTANHYLVDGVAGVVVALTGLVLAERFAARRTPPLRVMVPAPREPRGS